MRLKPKLGCPKKRLGVKGVDLICRFATCLQIVCDAWQSRVQPCHNDELNISWHLPVIFQSAQRPNRPNSQKPAMICAKSVFRCFKTLERWGNYITGAAGPFFVGLAIILLSLGVICFCTLNTYVFLGHYSTYWHGLYFSWCYCPYALVSAFQCTNMHSHSL